MSKSGNKVSQVKKDINNEIRLIFAIAFFIMLLGCVILLFLTENNLKAISIKSILMLLIFVFMYLVCTRIIKGRIEGLFSPVDNLIKDNDEKLDFLQKEKADNLGSIEAARKDNEDIKNTAFDSLKAFSKSSKTIADNEKEITLLHEKQEALYKEINDIKKSINSTRIKARFSGEELIAINEHITSNSKEINNDYEELRDNFNSLQNILDESMEVVDSLLSELSIIQEEMASINANSSHVALENARLGRYSFTMTNGLDEIKRLSSKVDSKTDDIAGLIVKSRTNVKLAQEQTDYLEDIQNQSVNVINDVMCNVESMSDMAGELVKGIEDMSENLESLYKLSDELIKLGNQGKSISQSTYKENEALKVMMNNMGESLKNK